MQRLSAAAALALCVGSFSAYLAYRLLGGADQVKQFSTHWLGPALGARLGWSEDFLSLLGSRAESNLQNALARLATDLLEVDLADNVHERCDLSAVHGGRSDVGGIATCCDRARNTAL